MNAPSSPPAAAAASPGAALPGSASPGSAAAAPGSASPGSAASHSLLHVHNLSVHYGSVPAVQNVDLHVARGEVVGVVGPNGAGKSTLLAAITRAEPWSSGQITFDGQALAGLRPEQVARRGVGLVPEGRHIFANMTVAENLELGFIARRGSFDRLGAIAEIHALFPILAEFAQRRAGLLSGGQQQQLAIARALVAHPDLLLLDEPSLGLAPTMIDLVFGVLDAVRQQGRTILVVEQRARRTIAFADRTYVLAGGRVRAELGRADADNSSLLHEAYFGARS
jgi:branched-chain amino acid transport system ATP-binding protein